MTAPWSPETDDRGYVAEQVRQHLGAIFRTVRRDGDMCPVCAGPDTDRYYDKCKRDQQVFGDRLADSVVPLAYAVRGQQSGHHMYNYKGTLSSSEEVRRDLKFLVYSAMYLHRGCLGEAVGQQWSAVTFVPSKSKPGVQHPAVELAQQVTVFDASAHRLVLDLGPTIDMDRSVGPLRDRFIVPEQWRDGIRDRHVLVVDDTWVTGMKSQSAAIALKDAGARAVTILCVARWLDASWGTHAGLIDSLKGPFDALLCPVTGGACPEPTDYSDC